MRTVAVNIGSNLGDRMGNLRFAVSRITDFAGDVRTSNIYETKSWGYASSNPFFNICVTFESDLAPEEIYARCHEIELAAGCITHRDASGGYIDRLLDIDIILIGDEVINTDVLTIPHPRYAQRAFVILPLAELLPEWCNPQTGETVAATAAKINREPIMRILEWGK